MTRSRRRARHATKTRQYDPESRPRMPFRPRCNQGTFDGGATYRQYPTNQSLPPSIPIDVVECKGGHPRGVTKGRRRFLYHKTSSDGKTQIIHSKSNIGNVIDDGKGDLDMDNDYSDSNRCTPRHILALS